MLMHETVAFLFAYTAVRNEAQNLGFSCATSIAINILSRTFLPIRYNIQLLIPFVITMEFCMHTLLSHFPRLIEPLETAPR